MSEVRRGYKQTEVGVIPEDWDVVSLGALAPIQTGTTPPTNDPRNYGEEFLFVSPFDMGSSKYIGCSSFRRQLDG
jgi:type I restriction enzyme S subunit